MKRRTRKKVTFLIALAALLLGLGSRLVNRPAATASLSPGLLAVARAEPQSVDPIQPRVVADAPPVAVAHLVAFAEPVDTSHCSAARNAEVAKWMQTNAEEAERHLDVFCEEHRQMAAAAVLPEPRRTHDAASYLGVRVDWEGGRQGTLHLPQAIISTLSTGWTTLRPRTWAGLDFSWLEALLAYDHWSLSADGPVRNADGVGFEDAPLPDFKTLVLWSKLRLAKGINEGDLSRASGEVVHLAALSSSTATLLGENAATALLELDRLAWEASGASHSPVSGTEEQQARRVRLTFSGPSFFLPGVPVAIRDRALACSAAMRCSAVTEALWVQVALRDVTGPEGIDWLTSQPNCDQGLTDRIVRGRPLGADEAFKLVSQLEENASLGAQLTSDAGLESLNFLR